MYTEPIVSITRKGNSAHTSECLISKKAFEFIGKPKEIVVKYDVYGLYIRTCTIDDRQRKSIQETTAGGHRVAIPKEAQPGKFLLEQDGDKYRLIPVEDEQ